MVAVRWAEVRARGVGAGCKFMVLHTIDIREARSVMVLSFVRRWREVAAERPRRPLIIQSLANLRTSGKPDAITRPTAYRLAYATSAAARSASAHSGSWLTSMSMWSVELETTLPVMTSPPDCIWFWPATATGARGELHEENTKLSPQLYRRRKRVRFIAVNTASTVPGPPLRGVMLT